MDQKLQLCSVSPAAAKAEQTACCFSKNCANFHMLSPSVWAHHGSLCIWPAANVCTLRFVSLL